jgi:hypothetical protein
MWMQQMKFFVVSKKSTGHDTEIDIKQLVCGFDNLFYFVDNLLYVQYCTEWN